MHATKPLTLLIAYCLFQTSAIWAEEPTHAARQDKLIYEETPGANGYEGLGGSEYIEDTTHRYRATYQADGDYRQPIDIEFFDRYSALITTKLTGQIYELNLRDKRLSVVHQDARCGWGAALHLGDGIVAIADGNLEQLVLFRRGSNGWRPTCRMDVPGQPHSLAWDEPAQTLYATGLWSRQLMRWLLTSTDMARAENWTELERIDLRMCGGEILLLAKQGLVLVTDAFGRNYRLIDRDSGNVVKSDRVYGHNISSLVAVSDESMVLFPHQLLNEYAQSVRGDITWGNLMSNNLRWLHIDHLLNKTGQDIFKQGRFYPLGSTGNGSGDPTSLSVSGSGLMAITLGGTNRVAIGREGDYYFHQLDVGYHPVNCEFSPDDKTLVVVNQFSDSLSLIDLEDEEGGDGGLRNESVEHLLLGELRRPDQVEGGEQAFFNARLSHDGWMSCHSCHSHGHTNGQLNDNLTDRTSNTPKRVLSLLGQSETMPYSWGGDMERLEDQIAHSIGSTMASDRAVSPQTVADIAAFIRSLRAPPSVNAARKSKVQREDFIAKRSDRLDRGANLFNDLGCAECHRGSWFTSRDKFDVGLTDEAQMHLYNPPSLIAVSQRQDVLFHDGRAGSLREVIESYSHQLPRELSSREISLLVDYLENL